MQQTMVGCNPKRVQVYWGFGWRLLAAETLEPHCNSSLLVSSLWTITSMKHKLSFSGPVAVLIASTSSSSQNTWNVKFRVWCHALDFATLISMHWSKRTTWLQAHLGCPALAFTIVDGINQASVVPVLNHIVRTVMDFDFNCVSAIVDEEDDVLLSTS